MLSFIRVPLRSSAILFCVAFSVQAQDATEIVRRSIALEDRYLELSRNYTYQQRQETRETDSSGKLKKTGSETFDILLLEGSHYRRHIAHDDKPLPPAEQSKEDEKFRQATAERRKETPEQRNYRIAEWERHRRKQREPYRQVPDAFNLKVAGEETIAGVPTWIIDATPKPGYKPVSNATRFFPKMKGRIWIARADYEVLKVDIESLDTISFGGFLVRMAKGSHIVIDAEHVNNEVWMPAKAVLRGSVRIALIKVIRGEVSFTFSNYKKAAVVSAPPLP
ncbi:MAG TPA: hypothetical protein VKE70_09285 [Candidatus Solibacter sp.]|nr:hypothetical protein [Candidatus Solibacter sp.]